MKNILKCQLAYWIPVYVWAALIFYFSSGTITDSVANSPNIIMFKISDYYKHLFAYGFLTFLLWRAFHHSRFKYSEFLAIATSFLYGVGNEFNQFFVPGRNFSLIDISFDFISCILVQPLIWSYKKIRR